MFLNAAISALNTVNLNGGELTSLREFADWIHVYLSSLDIRSVYFGFFIGFLCPFVDFLSACYLRRKAKKKDS